MKRFENGTTPTEYVDVDLNLRSFMEHNRLS